MEIETPTSLWAKHQRDERITDRVVALYKRHRETHGTTVREICDRLKCSTSCLYGHLNNTQKRQPKRMVDLVVLLGGDPVEVLEDENAMQFVTGANDALNNTQSKVSRVDMLVEELSENEVVNLAIEKAHYMSAENLSLLVRELIEIGWNQAKRPLEIPF